MLSRQTGQGAGLAIGSKALRKRLLTTRPVISSSYTPSVQDIVNEAMLPVYRARLQRVVPQAGPSDLSKPRQRAVTIMNQTNGALRMVAAVHFAQEASTSEVESSMIRSRNSHIARLIKEGHILSAMNSFTEAVNDSQGTPFSIHELEHIMRTLRIQSKQHRLNSNTEPSKHTTDADWHSTLLDPTLDARNLPESVLCLYAMSHVYDTCKQMGLQVTSKIVAPLLATSLNHLDPTHLMLMAEKGIKDLITGGEGVRHFSYRMLSSLILICGQAGKPEVGEQLLHEYAKEREMMSGHDKAATDLRNGISTFGWGHNVILWNCLIKARKSSNDLAGSRRWLDQYRIECRRSDTNDVAAGKPELSQEPYVAYMIGLKEIYTNVVEERPIGWMSRKQVLVELHAVISLMQQDQQPIDDGVLAIIIDVATSADELDQAVSLFAKYRHVAIPSLSSALLRSLYPLRAAMTQSFRFDSSRCTDIVHLPTTRQLVDDTIRAGEDTSDPRHADIRHRGLLNTALQTTLAERDYPAAIIVLEAFRRWGLQPSGNTYYIVVKALLDQGHQAEPDVDDLPGLDAGRNEPNTKVSHLDAQQGQNLSTDLPLEIVKRLEKPGVVSVASFTSLPSNLGLRPRYLISLLRQACLKEIEVSKSGAEVNPIKWLPKKTSPNDTAEIVARKAILAARKELTRPPKVHPAHRQYVSGRFAARPSLTAPKSSYATSRRMFSIGTTSAADTSAASSCSLSSSGDYSELEPVRVQYLPGFVPYKLGLALQEQLVAQRADARAALRASSPSTSAGVASGHHSIEPSANTVALTKTANQDTLLLLQHRPVYTEGRREENENELMSQHLRSLGADYFLTKRGGQITYHGPGQLVGYPILNLASMNLASRCYVDRVQDTLISMLATESIDTVDPPESNTGVWADEYHKIASIGIQVRHRISSHGFALNVESRSMRGFQHITACGIVGRSMTCMADRSAQNLSVQDVATRVTQHFAKVFKRQIRPATPDEFKFILESENAQALQKGLGIAVHESEQVITGITVDGTAVQAL